MKLVKFIIGLVLVFLTAATIAGVLWTREVPQAAEAEGTGKSQAQKKLLARTAPQAELPLVDLRPLQTARRIAALAATPDEQRLAREAVKVGDHETDLAFLDALRTAEQNPPKLTPAARQLLDVRNKAEQAVSEDQANVAALTKKLADAPAAQKDNLQDQLDVAKAQLELDQYELEDSSEDLAQAGGDPQAKIKRLQAEHEAAGHDEGQIGSGVNAREQDYQAHTLLAVGRAWQALREKKQKVEEAREETLAKQQRLSKRHTTLTAQVEQEKENREAVKQQAKGFAKGSKTASREASAAAAKQSLDALKQYTRDQKNLADLGRRLQDEQELNEIYGNWIALVETRQWAAMHNILEAVLWILLVVLIVYAATLLIDHLFTGLSAENKRIDTLRTVVKFAAEAVGVIAIVFIVIGMPSQTTTILGLAGAGLTVAMKDFIVAFFGWFILMGKNGLRVGDWVEINGVGGEVAEIGLLKTVLLETGSWTDAGHPTGRRVSFVNSFAIEGHYFNFSTSGQWMWDELQVLIPPGQDPYPVIDGIQKLVDKETEANSRRAEEEWHKVTSRYRVQAFTAVPGVNVVPTAAGIEMRVRYITRAYERYETRKRLYEAVVAMMTGKREAVKA